MGRYRLMAMRMRPEEPLEKWENLVVFGTEPDTSAGYMILRRQYDRAMNGHVPSIKTMLKMIKANEAARGKRAEYASGGALPPTNIEYVTSRAVRQERLADPALLLLGIGLVSNHTIRLMGEPDEPWYVAEVKALRPSHLARWVRDWALGREDAPELEELELESLRVTCGSMDEPDFSLWAKQKDELVARIVAMRGPEGTRFNPGESGNHRGRPRKKVVYGYPEEDPMGYFFSEVITANIHGIEQRLARLDALMLNLSIAAARGNEKICDVLAPTVVQAFVRQWEERFEPVPIYETRF